MSHGSIIVALGAVVLGAAALRWADRIDGRAPDPPPKPAGATTEEGRSSGKQAGPPPEPGAAQKTDDTAPVDSPPAAETTAWRPPTPVAADEFTRERTKMVETQIESSWDFRAPVKDHRALEAMRSVPRHRFVPERIRNQAYVDSPLPIGHGQTISQPYIVALMTELLELTPESRVLEIGTGSGYQAAVLAHLTPYVYTIEIIKPLADEAQRVLREQGYTDVRCRRGDGYFGWPEEAPFDAVIVTCAAGHLPPPLWDQLNPGGRIVIPIGGPREVQRLVLITKTREGERRSRTITEVSFVPLTRENQP